MSSPHFRLLVLSAAALALSGCATATDTPAATPAPESPRPTTAAAADRPRETPREAVTATEAAVAERRASASASRDGGTSADVAKLVDQLNEAAKELATLRTANAKLRAERERPGPAAAPAPVAVAKPDPAEERLAASLKSFAQFKQEMTNLLSEVERLKRANTEMSADVKSAAEQARQAKAALTRVEDDLRIEKRLRQEADANAGQLREQLRTIARAMTDVGLSAEKLTAQSENGAARGRTTVRPPTKYVVREGDTLMKIAERMYGDSEKWRAILEANRGRVGADGALEVGSELQIPRN